jgi:signal transduction histidine kinase
MGKQDEQRDDPLAPEVIQALTDLARLAQHASSVATDAPERFAGLLLERLLALCAAQCGALFLTSGDRPLPEQERLPAFFYEEGLRTVALRNINEEKAHDLLAVAPDAEALVRVIPAASCWLAFHFPPTHAFSPHLRAEFSPSEMPAVPTEHNVQIVLLLGWTGLQIEQSVGVVEKARSLLSRVADSVETVMQNLLLAERVRELEAAVARGTLREMELLKAELLATVSHELRSPLASIKGYTSTLLRHGRRISSEERREFVLAIAEASNRLETSINRLLEMSELEMGAIRIERSPINVAHLAREAMTAVEQRVAARPQNMFSFNLRLVDVPGSSEPGEYVVMADQRRLREVLDHLLENALNFSPQGGAIDVIVRFRLLQANHVGEASGADAAREQADVQAPVHVLEICVCDNGLGIPSEHLDRIFERFHRLDNGLTRVVNGLGLGLPICKRIIELHQGSIWAESCPAGGSAFHLLLPVEEEDEIPTPLAGAISR